MAAHQKQNRTPHQKPPGRIQLLCSPRTDTFVFSAANMASGARFSYRRLRSYRSGLEEEDRNNAVISEVWSWHEFRKLAGGRRRLKKVRVPGLRKFLRRRSGVLLARLKVSWSKAMKRLKNGQVHMNDLFGGNYLCLQVNPSPLNCSGVNKKPPYYI